MGDGSNSYLYRALVVDKPLAVSANASYQGTAVDATQFSIAAAPKQGVSFAEVEQAIDAVIANLTTNSDPRGGPRAREDAVDRAGDLRPGQSGDAGTLVRRGRDGRI